jgi:hypothetical protein
MTAFGTVNTYDTSLTNEKPVKVVVLTGDSAYTHEVSNPYGGTVRVVSAFDNTTGDAVTATVSSNTITVDASGGNTGNTYTVQYMIA